MPVSPTARRMGAQWNRLLDRLMAEPPSIPANGLARSAFADRFMPEVDPVAIDEVLKLLHARRIVWVSRRRGDVRVFRERPPQDALGKGGSSEPVRMFLAAVVAHFHGLHAAERARVQARQRDDWAAHGEADDTIRGHVSRILGVCRTHAEKGLSVEAMREAMHETFADDAMAAVAYYEPRLQQQSKAETLELQQKLKKKRIARNLSLEEKIFRIVERAGKQGITKTGIAQSIMPRLSYLELSRVASDLVDAGLVVAGTFRLQASGRPGTRYFEASIGIPRVDADGIARFAEPV